MINAMQWISTIHLDFIFERKIPDKCSERANELKMKVIPSSLKWLAQDRDGKQSGDLLVVK